MFENFKRKMHGIAFYRVYYKPLGEQTGWSKYGDAYDGMPTSIPQDRFFDIEDPPKNRTYLCVGIKKDGKWAIGSDIPGTWKKKHGEDESVGESKAELKKRLEKLEKSSAENTVPSSDEIAGRILMDKLQKKMDDGADIWDAVGSMLNPQSNNSDNNNPFADTKIEIDGKMPWYAHPAIANTYLQELPGIAEKISASFIKGADKEMAKRGQLPQQPPQQAEEGGAEEEALDIEVRPKSNTITRILAERATEKEAMEKVAPAEEEIPSEVEAAVERFDGSDTPKEEVGITETAPKLNIKESTETEEPIEHQTEEAKKQTLIERARDRIAAKKKIGMEEASTKRDIKEQSEPKTEEMPKVELEGKGREEIEGETAEEVVKREAMRERMRKAREARAANLKAKKEAEVEEIEVEA